MILAALTALALCSPFTPACDADGYPIDSVSACRASCTWWSRAERRCRDADVEYLGPWDPRPAPADWPAGYSTRTPEPWGAYPAEKANVAP